MSLPTPLDWSIPVETARVAQKAYPKGNRVMQLRDKLGAQWEAVYPAQDWAALFPASGQPAEAPGRLLIVSILQFMEGLTDRQAADAVRGRIDWKYALGLELTDPGFDYSILSEFRARLIAAEATDQLLKRLLDWCQAAGLMKVRGKQRTDSTHVLAAIRTLNRLELVGETLAAALLAVRQADFDWAQTAVPSEWWTRYGQRFDDFRLPRDLARRTALAEVIGQDGADLWQRLTAPETPPNLRTLPAVELLRQVWLQQYVIDQERQRWRTSDELPPNARLIVSPYDPEARFGVKRDTTWTGYKVHFTETCDREQPSLITHVATTGATTPDVELTAKIQADLAAHGRPPSQHLVDTGYMSANLIVTSRDRYAIDLIGPVLPDSSWQTRAQQGFGQDQFTLDWTRQSATCPQGHPSRFWRPGRDRHGKDIVHIWFDSADCTACPVRAQCTQALRLPRVLKVRPQAQHEALQAARRREQTPEFKQLYAQRAGVEGTHAQGTRAFEVRQARYLGQAKLHLQEVLTAIAMNLVRLVAWWQEQPRAKTRHSRFKPLNPVTFGPAVALNG